MPLYSTVAPARRSYSKVISYAVMLIVTGLIVYFGRDLFKNISAIQGHSAVSVSSANQDAQVYLNGNLLGNTPFESKNLRPGENKIMVKSADRQYETTINFTPKTQVLINRDLGVSDNFSAGQNFWIEKSTSGTVLSVISEPSNAAVFIDNTQVGKTPYTSSTLTPGEYDLRVEAPGFEMQTTRIKIQSGFNLNSAVKLFPVPVPSKVNAFEGSPNLYDFSIANTQVTSDTQNWAKAVAYWNRTRGINVAALGVNKEPVFGYLIDYKGDIYDGDGKPVADLTQLKDTGKGGYLGRTSDGAGISQQAKDALAKAGGALSGKTAKVLQTGTGWLRVRDVANLNGAEVARVDVGNSYTVLEEQTEWVKIKISESLQGWVSKSYVDISE